MSRLRKRAAAKAGHLCPPRHRWTRCVTHRPFPPAGPALARALKAALQDPGLLCRLPGGFGVRRGGREKQNPPRLRLRGFTVTGDVDDRQIIDPS